MNIISVIIPVYNSAKTIETCIKSILNQKYPDYEIIIVDDASKDNSVSIIQQFPAIKLIKNSVNSGVAYTRNIGASHSNGNILLFIDSDIRLPDDTLYKIHKAFTTQKEILLIQGNYSCNTGNLNFISDYKNLDLVYRSIFSPQYSKCASAFCFAVKTQVFLSSGGFDTDFKGSSVEDMELGYRICKGKNLTYSDRSIKVDHLKIYSFYSMLETDCIRIVNMMKIRNFSKGKFKAGEESSYKYHINIILAGLSMLLCCFFQNVFFTVILLIFFVNNSGFFLFLINQRNILFSVKAFGMLYIEYIVVFFALIYAIISQSSYVISKK